MDESTDRGDKERVWILIRYYDQSSLRVTADFVGLLKLMLWGFGFVLFIKTLDGPILM